MKKLYIAGLGLAISLGLATASFAATTATSKIVVQIIAAGTSIISNVDNTYGKTLNVIPGTATITKGPDGLQIKNVGNTTVSLKFRGAVDTVASPGWGLFTTGKLGDAVTGKNLRLSGLIYDWDNLPAATSFANDDVITTVDVACNSTTVYRDPVNSPSWASGVNIAAGSDIAMALGVDVSTASGAVPGDKITTNIIVTAF